jgi:hypothetical protein
LTGLDITLARRAIRKADGYVNGHDLQARHSVEQASGIWQDLGPDRTSFAVEYQEQPTGFAAVDTTEQRHSKYLQLRSNALRFCCQALLRPPRTSLRRYLAAAEALRAWSAASAG